ncbi:ABC transporter substrate-binding protein [uncultured Campylobacter sp.]|uniref:ABC transporter substrate-binding protein n=1 Tax=uncultured Campylobacter sp. TaxID=218934 RepID=UPI00261A4A04|nr:ABC transporter substrate-binding protein [uncultured Campylobacter sp.]
MKKILLILFILLPLIAKDSIVIAVENEPTRLNPVFSEDHDSVLALIFSGLTRFNDDMSLEPDLAKSWTISKDGLVYEFELRNDVFWHDGVKFSAKDVEFTLNTLLDKKLLAPSKDNFKDIKKVEVLSDTKVRITLSKPFPPLLDALSLGMLPKHILQKEDINKAKFNQKPIGTGPYKLKIWKKGYFTELEANDKFYLGKVKTKKLILKHIKDPKIAATELKSNLVDVALIDYEVLKDFQNDKNFKVNIEKSADYRALMFNFNNKFLKDINVRKALNYAVDKESIVNNLLHNLGFVANHPLENSWAVGKQFKSTYEYDLNKADEFLQKAGFKKNKNGIYEKNGEILEFEIYTMSNDPLRVALTQVILSEFKKLGVVAKGIAKPAGSFDYTRIDSFLVGWGSPYDPDFHTYRVFASEKDWNFGHYSDKEVDKSLNLARNTLDKEERKKEYLNFVKALDENPAFIFIAYIDYPVVFRKGINGVKNYILGHHGVGFAYNAWEWSID